MNRYTSISGTINYYEGEVQFTAELEHGMRGDYYTPDDPDEINKLNVEYKGRDITNLINEDKVINEILENLHQFIY